jgi:hypothetical protein
VVPPLLYKAFTELKATDAGKFLHHALRAFANLDGRERSIIRQRNRFLLAALSADSEVPKVPDAGIVQVLEFLAQVFLALLLIR